MEVFCLAMSHIAPYEGRAYLNQDPDRRQSPSSYKKQVQKADQDTKGIWMVTWCLEGSFKDGYTNYF